MTLTFRFALTMPYVPREYTTRDRTDPAAETAYDKLAATIRAEGVREWAPARPGKRRYRNKYWYPGDGWKYWEIWPVINRTRVEYYDANNQPLPVPAERATRAAALIKGMPAAERRRVTLARALEMGAV